MQLARASVLVPSVCDRPATVPIPATDVTTSPGPRFALAQGPWFDERAAMREFKLIAKYL
jgi:hypothetical protein